VFESHVVEGRHAVRITIAKAIGVPVVQPLILNLGEIHAAYAHGPAVH
jgi:hypothetical protein